MAFLFEFDVLIERGGGGIGASIGQRGAEVIVEGFANGANKQPGPAQCTGMVAVGDRIVRVGSRSVEGLAFGDVVSAIKDSPSPLLLGLRRVVGRGALLADPLVAAAACREAGDKELTDSILAPFSHPGVLTELRRTVPYTPSAVLRQQAPEAAARYLRAHGLNDDDVHGLARLVRDVFNKLHASCVEVVLLLRTRSPHALLRCSALPGSTEWDCWIRDCVEGGVADAGDGLGVAVVPLGVLPHKRLLVDLPHWAAVLCATHAFFWTHRESHTVAAGKRAGPADPSAAAVAATALDGLRVLGPPAQGFSLHDVAAALRQRARRSSEQRQHQHQQQQQARGAHQAQYAQQGWAGAPHVPPPPPATPSSADGSAAFPMIGLEQAAAMVAAPATSSCREPAGPVAR